MKRVGAFENNCMYNKVLKEISFLVETTACAQEQPLKFTGS